MASYRNVSLHTKPRTESPAKIFAKLKSKVQREEIYAKERSFNSEAFYGEKHGASMRSPERRPESTWIIDELKENQRFGPYRNEAQDLTLSPIPSPQKTCRDPYLDISSKPVEDERVFMQSTSVSHHLSQYNRTTRIHSEPTQTGHLDGFIGTTSSRTPVKMQPEEGDCRRRVAVEENARLDKLALMFSPMRKRLRKRKLESQEFNRLSSCTDQDSDDVFSKPLVRKASSAFSEDDSHSNTSIGDLHYVRGTPAERHGVNQLTHEPMLPPRSIAVKRRQVIAEDVPPLSPAKMFAYMKQRESKAEQQEGSSSRRDLFDEGYSHPSRDAPPSTAHNTGVIQAVRDPPDNVVQSQEESADSQSDTDVQVLAEPSHLVFLEDPLVLNTPRVSIPKKVSAVFKRNKWPQTAKFPTDSVIYLKNWFLRKNKKGLYVDGIHRDYNIPWNSNIIVDRVSNTVLKTVSGRVYILVGKMNLKADSEFPNWLLKTFFNGFPVDWKAHFEKSLSENNGETAGDSDGRGVKSKKKSGASSVNLSLKQHRQKKPLKTPASCPPPPSCSNQVSRSGRTIKPPLEYWKGGRVLLDANMNVTIHECYETSICIPKVTRKVSARASKNSACVFLPSDEGDDGCESSSDQEAPSKYPLRNSNKAKVSPKEEPAYAPKPRVKTLSSPDEVSGRPARSSRRYPATEKRLSTESVEENQTEPEKSSKRSKKQSHKTSKPPMRVSRREHAVTSSPESPPVNDKSQSSDEALPRRITRDKATHKKKGRKVVNQSRRSHKLPSSSSSESSEESPKETKRSTKVTRKRDAAQTQTKPKESKSTKISPPTKPLPKSTQSNKKEKAKKSNKLTPQDGDEWTEAELVKLQEAVSYYPKHMSGYWAKVARVVGTRSAEECHSQHTSQGTSQTPAKKPGRPRKQKVEAPKDPVTHQPLISARAGTLRRKQQVREFLEAMPKEDVDDVFSSAYMQNKRFEIPSMCQTRDHDFILSELEPMTPGSTAYPEVKTPQCLHITPGMIDSPNRSIDDKYVYQLQKRMRKNQFNVCKQASASKRFTPTPAVKRVMKRCGNTEDNSFVVWEMFPGNEAVQSDSGEEEDFYFSDDD